MDATKLSEKLMTKLRELSGKPDGWGDIRMIEPADAREILAALAHSDAAQVPVAWKLVPIEPTPEMTRSGWGSDTSEHQSNANRVYRAMIAAAPAQSGEPAKWVAKVRVTHKGYGMELSKYIAYALPEGVHELYAAPQPSQPAPYPSLLRGNDENATS